MTGAILKQIRELGYEVQIGHQGGAIVMRAIKGFETHEVTVPDDQEDADYLTVCKLAQSVGIDLEG